MVLGRFVGGFGSFWVVLGRFGWFWVVPCFSNYDSRIIITESFFQIFLKQNTNLDTFINEMKRN